MDEKNTDVVEIQDMLTAAIERAIDINKKALLLNDRSEKKPEPANEETPTGDVGIQIKDALERLKNIQQETYAALDEFV